jgi:hypothetical protein
MVVPPGWSPGDPLDPANGKWSVALVADGTTVTPDSIVTFHATVTNTGDQPQQTGAYDALAAVCTYGEATWGYGRVLGAATIAPGASQVFDVDLPIDAPAQGTAHCFVGITFVQGTQANAYTAPHAGLTSNVVDLTVLPAETTTSGP